MTEWTPFEEAVMHAAYPSLPGETCWLNNRYQVNMRPFEHPELGAMAHLSIKRVDKAPVHDWRELQRIKNEVVGAAFDAVEIYPAEDRLVDTANQYHLWVFMETRVPFGWNERLVSEDQSRGSQQRPFPADQKPSDLIQDMGPLMDAALGRKKDGCDG